MNSIQLACFIAFAQTLEFGCSDMKAEKNCLSSSSKVFELKAPVFRVSASPNGDFFAVGTDKCTEIIISKTQLLSEIVQIQPEQLIFSPNEPVLGIVTTHPDGRFHLAGAVIFWDYKATKEVCRVAINYGAEEISVLGAGAFSPDGKYFAVGSLNGTNRGGLLTLIDVKSKKIISQTNAPSSAVVSIAMDADANAMYAGTIADDEKKCGILDLGPKDKQNEHAVPQRRAHMANRDFEYSQASFCGWKRKNRRKKIVDHGLGSSGEQDRRVFSS